MAKQKTINLRGMWACDANGPNWCGVWELHCEGETKLVKIHGDIGDLLNLAHAVRAMLNRYRDKVAHIEKAVRGNG